MDDFILRAVKVPFVEFGRDFSGWDCWGIIRCFYRDVLGLDISELENVSLGCNPKLSWQKVKAEMLVWTEIEPGKEKVGDVALWRPLHAGIVLTPGKMLHCEPDTGTCQENYRNSMWRHKLIGFFRHASQI